MTWAKYVDRVKQLFLFDDYIFFFFPVRIEIPCLLDRVTLIFFFFSTAQPSSMMMDFVTGV